MSSGDVGKAPVMFATGADEGFAMPMAVMIHSALVNLEPGRSARIYILSDGISPTSRRKIETAAARSGRDADLRWITADLGELRDLTVTRWHTSIAYLRLRLPDLVSSDVERLIYLDSDVVVEGNLAELWRTPFDGHMALAVQNFDPVLLGGALGVPARELGLDSTMPYYNTGVMVMNLPRWREEHMLKRVVELTRRFAAHVDSADQDGINLAIGSDWGTLDPRWNVQLLTLGAFGRNVATDLAKREAVESRLLNEAHILHFTGRRKPWHFAYLRRKGDRFLHFLGRCGWMAPAEFIAYSLGRRAVWEGISTARRLRNVARRVMRPA